MIYQGEVRLLVCSFCPLSPLNVSSLITLIARSGFKHYTSQVYLCVHTICAILCTNFASTQFLLASPKRTHAKKLYTELYDFFLACMSEPQSHLWHITFSLASTFWGTVLQFILDFCYSSSKFPWVQESHKNGKEYITVKKKKAQNWPQRMQSLEEVKGQISGR